MSFSFMFSNTTNKPSTSLLSSADECDSSSVLASNNAETAGSISLLSNPSECFDAFGDKDILGNPDIATVVAVGQQAETMGSIASANAETIGSVALGAETIGSMACAGAEAAGSVACSFSGASDGGCSSGSFSSVC